MKREDLNILAEFIPDWILGIKDSMQLDSGQEVCSITVEHEGKTTEAYVVVHGKVRVYYKGDVYKAACQFPQELLDFFAGKRPDLKEDVEVVDSNWFEVFLDDPDVDRSDVVDDFNFTTIDDVRDWLITVVLAHLNSKYVPKKYTVTVTADEGYVADSLREIANWIENNGENYPYNYESPHCTASITENE